MGPPQPAASPIFNRYFECLSMMSMLEIVHRRLYHIANDMQKRPILIFGFYMIICGGLVTIISLLALRQLDIGKMMEMTSWMGIALMSSSIIAMGFHWPRE
jgi:hypothetical protein